MQNSLNKDSRTVVEFTSKSVSDVKKGVSAPSEFVSMQPKLNNASEALKTSPISPIKSKIVRIIKKDGTTEIYDNSKIINAVKKSATRA